MVYLCEGDQGGEEVAEDTKEDHLILKPTPDLGQGHKERLEWEQTAHTDELGEVSADCIATATK